MSYDPTQGRWLQQDPSGWPDGSNRYEAMRSAPTKYTDPTGLVVGGGGGAVSDLVARPSTYLGGGGQAMILPYYPSDYDPNQPTAVLFGGGPLDELEGLNDMVWRPEDDDGVGGTVDLMPYDPTTDSGGEVVTLVVSPGFTPGKGFKAGPAVDGRPVWGFINPATGRPFPKGTIYLYYPDGVYAIPPGSQGPGPGPAFAPNNPWNAGLGFSLTWVFGGGLSYGYSLQVGQDELGNWHVWFVPYIEGRVGFQIGGSVNANWPASGTPQAGKYWIVNGGVGKVAGSVSGPVDDATGAAGPASSASGSWGPGVGAPVRVGAVDAQVGISGGQGKQGVYKLK